MLRKISCKMKGAAICAAVVLASAAARAQALDQAGVATTITGGLQTVYDNAATIGIAAVAIGFGVYFIRKGLALRK